MNNTINERLAFLEESKDSHFTITQKLSGEIEPIDIYAFMVLKRSISLVFGFIELIRQKNFICAAPLIRLQIDNLLRFRASFLVDDQSLFVVEVLQGKEVRNIKDRLGRNMTDIYLQNALINEYSWLKGTYKNTSGYVHLSDKHLFNTLRKGASGKEGALDIYIGPDDKMVNDEVYEGAIEDMILVTHALLTFIANWTLSKNKPSAQ